MFVVKQFYINSICVAPKRVIALKHIFKRTIVPQKVLNPKTFNELKKLRVHFKNEERNGDVVPIFKEALFHHNQVAIQNSVTEYTYQQLYLGSKRLSIQISNICGSGASCNVAVFCESDVLLPLTQWGCWMSGQVFMPLVSKLPIEKLKYIIRDSNAKIIIGTELNEIIAKKLADMFDIPLIIIDQTFIPNHCNADHFLEKMLFTVGDKVFIEGTLNNDFYSCSAAMLVYSSDEKRNPKGCIITHKNLQSRIKIILGAWNYKSSDFLLNLLPAEYTNYSVHSLMCFLSVGAKIHFYWGNDYLQIWNIILGKHFHNKDRPNSLTAVPSTFCKIIHAYKQLFSKNPRMSEYIKNYCKRNYRIMVSGPLPLPINTFYYWNKITGHELIRYYETPETGHIMSNPHLEVKGRHRMQSSFAQPLPQITIRIVNTKGETILSATARDFEKHTENNRSQAVLHNTKLRTLIGELQVSGTSIFKKYIHQEDTTSCFEKGFFKTGIAAEFKDCGFRLLGRIDRGIVKKSGRLISSDEIEALLQTHPNIKDAAVISVPHSLWNDKICVLCVLEAHCSSDIGHIKLFCEKWLPSYMQPDIFKIVPHIIRTSEDKIEIIC
ncbi:acyl-CoA synthetase family member 3, mitochondrial [Ceratitis capitata]|uniref:(Mediterranean fruit fly) hypothetical protein n=1 Tax=Ceratitis capitata TaxID=7213 RepID=W8C7X4_CERCA|nr:acyl-CoA synthetase family member 3, mitochondrial [Ceratitis capitata]CAD7013045.1 unnamed protein product [Ceratitis capitata]